MTKSTRMKKAVGVEPDIKAANLRRLRRIEGQVRCANLVVNGYIAGTVYSSDLLELQPKGRIHGDVHYRLLEMHGGALVTGKLTHEADRVSAAEPVFHLGAVEAGASA